MAICQNVRYNDSHYVYFMLHHFSLEVEIEVIHNLNRLLIKNLSQCKFLFFYFQGNIFNVCICSENCIMGTKFALEGMTLYIR